MLGSAYPSLLRSIPISIRSPYPFPFGSPYPLYSRSIPLQEKRSFARAFSPRKNKKALAKH